MKRHKFSTNIYTIFNLEIQAAVVKGRQETHTEFPQCGCKNITKNSDLSNKKQIWKQFGTSYLEYLRNFEIQNLSKFKAKYWPLQLVPISHQ